MDEETLARQACEGSTYAAECLDEIGHDNPAAIAPFLPALYESGVRWPPGLYRAADEALVRHFVELGDAAELAWSPLPIAREAIIARPEWHDAAVDAGWTVTAARGAYGK